MMHNGLDYKGRVSKRCKNLVLLYAPNASCVKMRKPMDEHYAQYMIMDKATALGIGTTPVKAWESALSALRLRAVK